MATGWGKFDIVMAGDLTGDGVPDLLARDNKTGVLYTYPGNGKGGHDARITVGAGWSGMGQISVGDYDGDGVPDVFATSFSDGKLYLYPGLGDGNFGARDISRQWDGLDVVTIHGDLNGDGFDEFLARWNYNGRYYVYSSQGGTYELPQDLNTYGIDPRFEQVVGLGDLTRDGRPDIGATDLKTGQLFVRSINLDMITELNGNGIGSGWNGVRLPVTLLDRTYDYDYDGFSDVIAQRKSDGDLYLYWGTGAGLGTRWNLCDNCDGITTSAAGGDYTADGRTDLLYRAYTGALYVVPGLDNTEIGFTTGIQAGTGWNGMDAITGGQDYNGDGRDDLLARQQSTGKPVLLPGQGQRHLRIARQDRFGLGRHARPVLRGRPQPRRPCRRSGDPEVGRLPLPLQRTRERDPRLQRQGQLRLGLLRPDHRRGRLQPRRPRRLAGPPHLRRRAVPLQGQRRRRVAQPLPDRHGLELDELHRLRPVRMM